MRIECVVDPRTLVHVEREAERRAPLTNAFLILRELLGCRAVLLGDVLDDVLAFRRHLRIEFERLKMNVRRHFGTDAIERVFKRLQTHHTPGAGDVRNEIDFEVGSHKSLQTPSDALRTNDTTAHISRDCEHMEAPSW